jgi:hypothetical protein
MNNQPQYAVDTLKEWHNNNLAVLSSMGAESVFESWGDKAEIRVDSEQYLSSICAWDHASCLDIISLDVKSEEQTYPTAGPCSDRAEFLQHLDDYLTWLSSEYGNGASHDIEWPLWGKADTCRMFTGKWLGQHCLGAAAAVAIIAFPAIDLWFIS